MPAMKEDDSTQTALQNELHRSLKLPILNVQAEVRAGLAQHDEHVAATRAQNRPSRFAKLKALVNTAPLASKNEVMAYCKKHDAGSDGTKVVESTPLVYPVKFIEKPKLESLMQDYRIYTTVSESFPTTEDVKLNYLPTFRYTEQEEDKRHMELTLWRHYENAEPLHRKIWNAEKAVFQQELVDSFLQSPVIQELESRSIQDSLRSSRAARNSHPDFEQDLANAFYKVTGAKFQPYAIRSSSPGDQMMQSSQPQQVQGPAFCAICFTHDCVIHALNIHDEHECEWPSGAGYKDRLQNLGGMDIVQLERKPCSETCFAFRIPIDNTPVWTGDEERDLAEYWEVYQYNSRAACLIQEAFPTRSCAEVHCWLKDHPVKEKPIVSRKKAFDITDTPNNAKRGHYRPCDHTGPCTLLNDCSCAYGSIECEKSCGCSVDCKIRWVGCTCQNACGPTCPCVRLLRECDPDVCGCKASATLDPYGKRSIYEIDCDNVSSRKGEAIRMLIAKSGINSGGFGLFAGEKVKKDQYIGDYIGELINDEENTRRGTLYDFHKCSYLFNLSETRNIDAFRAGNKLRFMNHAEGKGVNVGIEGITLVNGNQRLKFKALKIVNPGDEMFFDYGQEFFTSAEFDKPSYTATTMTPGRRLLNSPAQVKSKKSGHISTPSFKQTKTRGKYKTKSKGKDKDNVLHRSGFDVCDDFYNGSEIEKMGLEDKHEDLEVANGWKIIGDKDDEPTNEWQDVDDPRVDSSDDEEVEEEEEEYDPYSDQAFLRSIEKRMPEKLSKKMKTAEISSEWQDAEDEEAEEDDDEELVPAIPFASPPQNRPLNIQEEAEKSLRLGKRKRKDVDYKIPPLLNNKELKRMQRELSNQQQTQQQPSPTTPPLRLTKKQQSFKNKKDKPPTPSPPKVRYELTPVKRTPNSHRKNVGIHVPNKRKHEDCPTKSKRAPKVRVIESSDVEETPSSPPKQNAPRPQLVNAPSDLDPDREHTCHGIIFALLPIAKRNSIPSDHVTHIVLKIEHLTYTHYLHTISPPKLHEYKLRMRVIFMNLKRNGKLASQLLDLGIRPEEFCAMSEAEMATDEMKKAVEEANAESECRAMAPMKYISNKEASKLLSNWKHTGGSRK